MGSVTASAMRAHPVPRPGAGASSAVIEQARRRARRRRKVCAAGALMLLVGLLAYVGAARGSAAPSAWTARDATPGTVVSIRTSADREVVLGHRVGGYAFDVHDRLADAKAVFGAPAARRTTDPDVCELSWPREGITLSFRSASPAPCTGAALASATWTGAGILSPAWSVDRGLHVGDTWRRLQQLYPALASYPSPGDGSRISIAQRPVPLPHTEYVRFVEMDAVISHGRVSRIDVDYG